MIILHFDCIESTQIIAQSLLKNGMQDFVVIADQQTAGIGRLNTRVWQSPYGNLYTSIVLTSKNIFIDDILDIIAEFITEKTSKLVTKKYPNDILISGKKIAGVIIQNINNYTIVGIGININTSPLDTSTCLLNEGFTCKPLDILRIILKKI